MKQALLALVALALLATAAPAAEGVFYSPKRKYRVEFQARDNVVGTDVKPMRARIFEVEGATTAVAVSFQLIRYSDPTTRTVEEAFRWPEEEFAVAVENRPGESKYGFRMVPLRPGLGWKSKDIAAKQLTWVDGDRLVYRGDGEAGYFIGVFDARSGRSRIANSRISSFTEFKITEITPDAIHFREETSAVNGDVCYAFNTNTGKRTVLACPR